MKNSTLFGDVVFYALLAAAIWMAISFIGSAMRVADQGCGKTYYVDRIVF